MEIKIKLNGKERLLDKALDITSFLLMLELSAENLIVELNRELLHKNKYGQTILENGDKLELIKFAGGG